MKGSLGRCTALSTVFMADSLFEAFRSLRFQLQDTVRRSHMLIHGLGQPL